MTLCSRLLNGLEPWTYLRDVLDRLHKHLNSRIDDLPPHRWLTGGGPLVSHHTSTGMKSRHGKLQLKKCSASVVKCSPVVHGLQGSKMEKRDARRGPFDCYWRPNLLVSSKGRGL